MPTLVELATQIVAAQTSSAPMSTEDILSSLTRIHSTLGQLENGVTPGIGRETIDPGLTIKRAFKKNEVVCMICGKGFKTLGRHLSSSHGINPREYRKQFGIPTHQVLVSKVFGDTLKKIAAEKSVAQNLTKARDLRAGKEPADKTMDQARAESAAPAEQVQKAVKVPKTAAGAAARTPAKHPGEPAAQAPQITAPKPPGKKTAMGPKAVAAKTTR